MNNTKLVILISFVVGLMVLSGCSDYMSNGDDQDKMPGGQDGSGEMDTESRNGRMVFTMTDAAANMGSVTEVKMTTSNVQAHSKTKGWVTLENSPQTYNLLELKSENKAELMADMKVEADEFTQIRFDIDEVIVVDSEGEHEAKVPSNEYKVNVNTKVESEQTSTVEIDVIADESLHVTGDGQYIMAPVAEVEAKSNAQVAVRSDNSVSVSGGSTTSKTKVGMDINGNVGVGLGIPADVELKVDGLLGGGLSISGSDDASTESSASGSATVGNEDTLAEGKGKVTVGITDAAADMGSVSEVHVTVDEVRVHSETQGWVTLTTDDRTYDLLELNSEGKTELVIDAEIDSRDYNQIRLDVKDVVVVDGEGEHNANLPSGELKIMHDFSVESKSTTAITFDIKADESLHVTGNGEYILAPVVLLESREGAQVSLESGNKLNIQGGQRSEVRVGMDINGNVGVGKGILANANLRISSSGKIGLI